MNLKLYTINPSNDSLDPTNDFSPNPLLHGAFKVRYEVYHDEMGVVPENEKHEICDPFDFIKDSYIFLATDDDKPVGTLRLTKYSEKNKIPLLFNNKYLEEELDPKIEFHNKIKDGRIFSEGSRFTVLKEYRRNYTGGKSIVSTLLVLLMYDKCTEEGITDMIIVVNPQQLNLYKKAGFEIIGTIKDYLTGIESPIMYAELDDGFGKFVRKLKFKVRLDRIFYGLWKIPNNIVNL